MRKLVFILIASMAVVTFIRAFDNSAGINAGGISSGAEQSETFHAAKVLSDSISGN